MTEILITGGNGFVGRHLVSALQERGDQVRVLTLPAEDATWLEERGVSVYRGDVGRPESLVAPMRGVEQAIHLAGMMDVWRSLDDYRAVNVIGTENVCRSALAAGVRRLVHMSSSSVYGMALGVAVREDRSLAPLQDPYPMSKAEGDRLVQRMIIKDRLPAVIIRPDQIFGPGDELHFARMADRVRARKAIIVGSGRNAVPFVYVTDVVQGLLLALDREGAAAQAYNITNDQALTQEAFFGAIAREIGAPPPRVHVPYGALYAAGYAAERLAVLTHSWRRPPVTRLGVAFFGTDNRFSIEKARRELGYAPQVPLREGVRLAAHWYLGRDASPGGTTPLLSPAAERVS
jgi:nucleoside-diphosphate-sugar epimerase